MLTERTTKVIHGIVVIVTALLIYNFLFQNGGVSDRHLIVKWMEEMTIPVDKASIHKAPDWGGSKLYIIEVSDLDDRGYPLTCGTMVEITSKGKPELISYPESTICGDKNVIKQMLL